MKPSARATAPLLAPTLACFLFAALAGCGGGGGGENAPPPSSAAPPQQPASTAMSGTVAVGAPITGGTLRILDAGGVVVAHDIAIDADGRYAIPAVGGSGPWRLEACGFAGANWRCLYTVATSLGTANVTPLTTALIALASGASPDSVMQAGAAVPGSSPLDSATQQLRSALTATLTNAGVSGSFDFVTGSLIAGSRSGYDGVLDAISVHTGTDNGAFVQLSPRIGDGNVYMTPGNSQGTIVPAAGSAALPLAGIETLFRGISAAMASADACVGSTTGVRQWIADTARMNVGGGERLAGSAAVAIGMCQLFASGGNDGDRASESLWGSRLVSPVLGRCDFSGGDPICGVSFALQGPDGAIQQLGSGFAVTYRAAAWKFYGDPTPIGINANAAVQRTRHLDLGTVSYSRALQFDIGLTAGVACARVFQRDATGSASTVAYFKVHDRSAQRMSLWVQDAMGGPQPSLDPTAGATRSSDDSWVQLPDGITGDDVVRNFYRGGRFVTVAVYADAACNAPAIVDGRSEFTVDVDGIPPVWAALPTLPWGELTDATVTAIRNLTLTAGVASTFDLSWTFAHGSTGFGEATFCVSGECGQGGAGRLDQVRIRPGQLTARLAPHGPVRNVAAGDLKQLMLGGRDGSGMNIESAFMTCAGSHLEGGRCQ